MKLKIFGVAVVAAILGFGAAVVVLNHPSGTRSSLPPAAGATAGEAASVPEHVTTKAVTASRVATQAPTAAEEIAASNAKRTLQDLLNELAAIQVAPGPGQARAIAHPAHFVQRARELLAARGVVGEQQLDAQRHVGQAAGGVDARAEREAEVEGGRGLRLAAGDVEQAGQSAGQRARADALRAEEVYL